MLFVYFIIFVCFNLLNINCDVHITNLDKHARRGANISRSIRDTLINSTNDQLDLIGTKTNVLETPKLNTNQLEYKQNNTRRVRKQKKRRQNARKNIEISTEYTPSNKETEENTVVTGKSSTETSIDILLKYNTPETKQTLENNFEVNKSETEATTEIFLKHTIPKNTKLDENQKDLEKSKIKNNIEIVLEHATAEAKKAVEEKIEVEKSDRNDIHTPVPRTFPKRPAEFNPVFKKRTRERDPVVKIINEKNFVYGHNGDFHYSFEGGDGTKVFSKGNLISSQDNIKAGESVAGGFFYKDGEGNDYSLSYTADENGYQPVGDHLPTPPPIPPAIARALKYLATKSTPEPVTEKYYS